MSFSNDKNGDPKEAFNKPDFPKQEQEWPGSESDMIPAPDYGEKTYKGLGRLEGKIAVITGADSGIGRAVALCFAREGADIVVAYYNEDQDAKQTEKVVHESGKECLLVKGDLSKESECKRLIDESVKKYGRIDILVNNAAFQGKQVEKIEDLSRERIEFTFNTNIVAMFTIVQQALKHMPKGGSIINVGSVQAYDPSAGILDYATSKAAIVGFTKGLAPKLLKENGIRVNCVAPGPVWTPLIVSSFPKEKVAEFGKSYAEGRPAQPVELAPAFVFLASNESSYICGEILSVTGGKVTA